MESCHGRATLSRSPSTPPLNVIAHQKWADMDIVDVRSLLLLTKSRKVKGRSALMQGHGCCMNAAGNEDGSIKQPLLILNADNGQQLYKGNTWHWRVWQSLIEEGEQLDDRDEVFRQVKPCITDNVTCPCNALACLLLPHVRTTRLIR